MELPLSKMVPFEIWSNELSSDDICEHSWSVFDSRLWIIWGTVLLPSTSTDVRLLRSRIVLVVETIFPGSICLPDANSAGKDAVLSVATMVIFFLLSEFVIEPWWGLEGDLPWVVSWWFVSGGFLVYWRWIVGLIVPLDGFLVENQLSSGVFFLRSIGLLGSICLSCWRIAGTV